MNLKLSSAIITFIGVSLVLTSHSLFAQARLETIAAQGDSANGDGFFQYFSRLYINEAGDTSFNSTLTNTSGGTSHDHAIYYRPAASAIIEVVRESSVAPDGNGTYSDLRNTGLSDDGHVLLHSRLVSTSGGSADDSGLFKWDNGTLSIVAREGDTTYDGNGEFGNFLSESTNSEFYTFNASGQTAFQNLNVNTSGGSTDNDAVFGAAAVRAREGDAAPGGIGNFSSFGDTVKLNGYNQTSFTGIANGIQGMYRADFSLIKPIMLEGDAAPDGNGSLGSLADHCNINDAGQIVFEAYMIGTANGQLDDECLLRGDGNSVVQIMREGETVPGGNGVFENGDIFKAQINESGQIAFSARLRETSRGIYDNDGLYRCDANGQSLVEIVRKGPFFDPSWDLGSFVDIALNDSGVVACKALFYGTNRSAVFVGDEEELLAVVRTTQSLAGSTVTSVIFEGGGPSRSGLNNQGQVFYAAGLANGQTVAQTWTPDLHWRRTLGGDWDDFSNWTLGLSPDSVHDVYIDPNNSLEVEGPSADTTVRGLTIGGGNGIATFKLEDGAFLTSIGVVQVESTGVLTGDGTISGYVVNRGTVEPQNVYVSESLFNHGILSGDGRVHAELIWNELGVIRVGEDEAMQLTGPTLENRSLIDVVGGMLEVSGEVTNADSVGLIFASDAFLRFDGGLLNSGGFGMTNGSTYVYGDIDNTSSGVINVSGDANVTFLDDLTQNGVLQVVSVGNTYSSAVFFGAFSGSGGFTGGGDVFALGDLRPGNSPASVTMGGNLYLGASTQTEIEIGGTLVGEFDQLEITGDFSLDGTLDVVLINGFTPSQPDEFLIIEVDGIATGEFVGLPQGSSIGSGLYIYYDRGDGNDIMLSTFPPTTELVPDSFNRVRGKYIAGDLSDVQESDDSYLKFNPGLTLNTSEPPVRIEFEGTLATDSPTSLSVTLEASVNTPNINQTIEAFNWLTGQYEQVDIQSASFNNDSMVTVDLTANISEYVETGTGSVKIRAGWKEDGLLLFYPWTVCIDQVVWTVTE